MDQITAQTTALDAMLVVAKLEVKDTIITELAQRYIAEWQGRDPGVSELESAITELKGCRMVMEIHNDSDAVKRCMDEKITSLRQLRKAMLFGEPGLSIHEHLKRAGNAIEEHPAFRDWSVHEAWGVLHRDDTAVGSFLICRDEDAHYVLYIKTGAGEGKLARYILLLVGDTHYELPAKILHDSLEGIDKADGRHLEELVATPFGVLPRRPGMQGLSDMVGELRSCTFCISEWSRRSMRRRLKPTSRWTDLEKATKLCLKSVEHNHDYLSDAEKLLRVAARGIAYHQKTAIHVMRDQEDVFMLGSHVHIDDVQTDMLQLPTDHSRDDFWLHVWNRTGESGKGRAVILKLSTPKCRMLSEPPILQPYWPLSEASAEFDAAKWEGRCKDRLARCGPKGLIRCNASATIATLSTQQMKGSAEESERLRLQAKIDREQALIDATIQQEKWIATQMQGKPIQGAMETKDGICITLDTEGPSLPLSNMYGALKLVRREFVMTKGKESRRVVQFDCDNWQDFTAVGSAKDLVTLLDIFEEECAFDNSPSIVHCRAGVGRTGVMVALRILKGRLKELVENVKLGKAELPNDVYEDVIKPVILELRVQRDGQVVQRPEQAQQLAAATAILLTRLLQVKNSKL